MGEGESRMSTALKRAERVAALFEITCQADLERRMRETGSEQLVPFFAVMPHGYSADEQAKWVAEISEALGAVTDDAHKAIMLDRTLATMKDLGIGDDGDGNFRP